MPATRKRTSQKVLRRLPPKARKAASRKAQRRIAPKPRKAPARKAARRVVLRARPPAAKPARKTLAPKGHKPMIGIDPRTLPGPETIVRKVLPNGIVILVRENFLSPSVVTLGSLWAGGLDEGDGKGALAALTASCLLRGTERRTFHQIYDQLESAGSALSFGSGMHTTSFYSRCLAEDFGPVLELAADAAQRPVFPTDQFERLRGEYLTHLAIREQDTGERAHIAFAEMAYAGHPYAHDDEGDVASVQALRREDLAEFRTRHFGPRGMIISVAGAVHSGKAIALIEKFFGDWKNPAQPERPPLPPAPRLGSMLEKRVSLPGKSQSDLVMGAPGPTRSSPAYLSAMLGNNILGVFGMYGRIGDAVREAEGLAYYSMSSLGGGLGPGPWMVMAGVNPRNLSRAVELIRREIGRFTQTRVSRAELADSQASIVGRMPLQLESNEGVASAMMNVELHNLGLDYYQRFPELIRTVTPEQILETARQYLHPDRLAFSVAGPDEAD